MGTDNGHYDGLDDSDDGEIDVRSLSHVQKKMYESQELFLRGYAAGGTIKAGIATAGVTRRAVELWRKHDKLDFKARFDAAHSDYTDVLEDKLHELIEGLKPGQNVIGLLARLNAELPSKYRPNVVPVDDTAKELLDRLRGGGRRKDQTSERPQMAAVVQPR